MNKDAFSSLDVTLPPLLRFGTSSWTYAGWQSLVYSRQYSSEAVFKRECLREYAECPLFQAAGIDSSFYAPPAVSTLRRYADQVPADFPFLIKAWEQITVPHFARHRRYGAQSGQANSGFLSREKLEEFLAPFAQSNFEPLIGAVVFQFQQLALEEPDWFLDRLEAFLPQLPKSLRFAVEVRSPQLLNQRYFAMLNRHGVTHCFTHWTGMPPLSQQMRAAAACGGLDAPFFAARILTPLGVSYASAVKKHAPYSEIRTPLPEMRSDVLRLAKRALEREVPALIIVNNRAEGCAPLTIDQLRALLAAEIAAQGQPTMSEVQQTT